MPDSSYEIRQCESCGLRYPLVQEQPFGTRCPACLGTTRVLIRQELKAEPPGGLTGRMKEERRNRIAVLLDNLRSAWNVGSILRSADGFGFMQAYLCGITPTADNEAVTKTALGAQDSVPWSYHKDAVKLVKGLKIEGWHIYALEDHPRAISIANFQGDASSRQSSAPCVLIVGNELTGVDPGLLALCDRIYYIPMLGEKRSFNVAIAFSMAAFALQAH